MLLVLSFISASCAGPLDVHLDAMGRHACLTVDGTPTCWLQQAGRGAAPGRVVEGVTTAVAVHVDASGACAVLADGRAACWLASDRLARDIGLDGVVDVVGAPDSEWSGSATCAVLRDGAVLCRGDNSYGQLGDGTFVSRDVFAPVVGIDDAIAIDRGDGASFCATMATGEVSCWGAGALGSLGDGRIDEHASSLPLVVALPGPASDVHSGLASSCALQLDGHVSCWGWRYRGQLADGRTCDSDQANCVATEPAVVADLGDAVALATGWAGSCVLDATGGATCWGALGAASTGLPRPVVLERPAVGVAVGIDFACFASPSGQVECVGT